MVEMQLRRMIVNERPCNGQLIVLGEKGGDRELNVLIGQHEIMMLKVSVDQVSHPRPMTHDLLTNVITGLGAEVVRLEIRELREATFFGTLVLNKGGKEIEIDCRPSDALVICKLNDVHQVFVEEAVLEEAGTIRQK